MKDHLQILSASPLIGRRSNGIDLLRAICCLSVVLAHLVPWTEWAQGPGSVPWLAIEATRGLSLLVQSSGEIFLGVLGFIVLSGYCIHRNGLRRNREEIPVYAARRCARIMPIYYIAMAFGIIAFFYGVEVSEKATKHLMATDEITAGCVAARIFFINAIVPLYPYPSCVAVGNGPLVTVTVEVLLYGLYALFFWRFVWRGKAHWILTICIVTWVAGVGVAAVAKSYPLLYNWWQNGSIYGFLPYWWIGAALIDPRLGVLARRSALPLALVWVAMTVVLVFYMTDNGHVLAEFRKLISAIIIGGFVVWLEECNIGFRNPLAMIGRASYSIYAFHSPIAILLCIVGAPWWLNLGVNIAVGALIYLAVEKPFIQYAKIFLHQRSIAKVT